MEDLHRTVILFNPRSMRRVGEDKMFKVVIINQRVECKWSRILRRLAVAVGGIHKKDALATDF